MSLSAKIREQLISGFRAELAEHVQMMTNGLLALEERRVEGEPRQVLLEDVFRAAHSLKGAARAVGVTAVEQLAHALEDILAVMQQDALELTPELFTACYRALDAIQAVQAAYESGETTPPVLALQALNDLEPFRPHHKRTSEPESKGTEDRITAAPEPEPLTPGKTSARSVPTERQIPNTHTERPEVLLARAVASPSLGGDETIRVSVSKLDALMAQLSELLVTKIRSEQRTVQMRQAREFVSQWQKDWLAVRGSYRHLVHRGNQDGGSALKQEKDLARLMGYVATSQERLREMNALINKLSREYDNDTMHTSLVIDALEQEIKRVRMLPLATITNAFGRMVRDLARSAGKEAMLEIEGAQVELDKRVLEQIKDPLIHLLRNAIDHGIETPDQRQAAGKPAVGRVTLKAEQLGKDVVIAVSDDGAGLDAEAIRRTALRRGYSSAEVQSTDEAELVELIFAAGFSTSPIITDVSGRGVGLDVVRRNVESLNGRINATWQPGFGSTFALTLPLTLTSSRGLLVRASNQAFAISLNAIERILHLRPEQITPLGGHDTIRYNRHPLTLVRLSDVLELPRLATPKGPDIGRASERIPIVILEAAERRMAFAVDELTGEQEVVIKGLGKQLARVGGIAGATVMGTGEVMLILNVADLIKLATRGERRPVLEVVSGAALPQTAQSKARILIVDDSVTTRTLEKNILEAAGYSVQIAIDGQEALGTFATGGVPDLVISDIAMPRLDGFGLTKHLKGDPRTANIPIILVTSLDSVEDKSRGIEAGADAYIVKSRFDQNNLLETIEQLI